ncbi:MAG: iron-containing alcohol dehydrogenase [Actinomycetota bacterium]|jgi:methanol:N,N-dimethyl-4-nitrosoaniline oxidoreductase|nr:iron-containing alcohol dehydrogenase [Actinomycetota bacterium]
MDLSRVLEFPVKEFFQQPRSLLGAGAYENAGPEAAAMGLKHVLFVTTGLRGTGIIDECRTNFENAGVSVSVYDKVETNPKDYNVMDAYKAFTESECDGFVSIGGGSPHDTTKGARVVAAHDGRNINEFQGVNASEKLENPPHIAINTTVGTGSETTPAAVITDLSSENAPHKWVAFDRAMTTTLAINDPVLCMTQPPEYVAYTGFDTIAHGSEAYVGRVQHLSCTPVALHAIRMVTENLREATYNPKNFKAMEGMVWAQYLAAQAFSSALLGILHSLSHAVCAYYDIHHGLNNGIGISRVWTYNQPAAVEKYADIAEAMGEDTRGMNPVQAADQAIDAVIRLAKDCGIPENFSQVTEYPKTRMGKGWYEGRPTQALQSDDAELQKMAEHMMGDLCTPGNPRDLTVDGAKEILRDCMYDPMERKTTNGYRQNIWGAAPAMGRKTHGYEGRGESSGVGREPVSTP